MDASLLDLLREVKIAKSEQMSQLQSHELRIRDSIQQQVQEQLKRHQTVQNLEQQVQYLQDVNQKLSEFSAGKDFWKNSENVTRLSKIQRQIQRELKPFISSLRYDVQKTQRGICEEIDSKVRLIVGTMPKAICSRLHGILELQLTQIKNVRFEVSHSNQRFLTQFSRDIDKAITALGELPKQIHTLQTGQLDSIKLENNVLEQKNRDLECASKEDEKKIAEL